MPPLTPVSGRQAIAAFQKADFEILRRRGSHIIIVKDDIAIMLTVPDQRQLKPGVPRALIRKAGLTAQQFEQLLK
jgi:predicted RNA binding protein YcfA (HicA-like mRNA interferase family)